MKINILKNRTGWKEVFPERILTKNLTGMRLRLADLPVIASAEIDPGIIEYVGAIGSPAELNAWLASSVDKQEYLFYRFYLNGQIGRRPDNPAGVVMLNRLAEKSIEVGGWVFRQYRNRGYGAEIITSLRSFQERFGFGASVHPENIAAQRLLEKSGFLIQLRKPGEWKI